MAIAHYRIYELDPADHILAGYSLMCASDAAALFAACQLGEKRAVAVEVWESGRCVAHLGAAEAARKAMCRNGTGPLRR
jgi:hypothetical protein